MLQFKVGQRVRVAGMDLAGSGPLASDLTGTVVAVDAIRQWVAVTFDGVAGQPTVLIPSAKVQPAETETPDEGDGRLSEIELARLEFGRWMVRRGTLRG